jgi:solute carrier family 25 iron transporter 28/37
VTAVCSAAIPSHALYFATYELSKKTFKGSGHGNKIFGDMLAGACATIVHDAIVTPLDVVKQRMQLFKSQHTSVLQTIKSVHAQSGIKGFYASYPVTLAMNVPHFSLYFATYEQTKRLLQGSRASGENSSSEFTPAIHCMAGAAAGASSSLVQHATILSIVTRPDVVFPFMLAFCSQLSLQISNPLDVIKTRLQTQGEMGGKLGIAQTVRLVYSEGGFGAFFRGLGARMLYHAPAAAFQMVTYEAVKVSSTICRLHAFWLLNSGKGLCACVRSHVYVLSLAFVQVALTAALWGGIFVAMNKQERKALKMQKRAAEEHAAAVARGEAACGEQVK